MTTRLVLKNPKTIDNITYKPKSKWKKKLLCATLFVSITLIACVLQFTYINNNPDMKDSFLMGGVVLERVERDDSETLKQEIDGYKKEIDKLNNENKLLIEKHKVELSSRGEVNRNSSLYDYTKLTAPKEISKIIETKCREIGFDNMDEIYPIVAYESNFNPKIRTLTKHEDSRGLLQVNVFSNYPKNLDKNKLYSPEYNLSYQLPELYDFYKLGKSKGLKGIELSCYLSRYAQRPLWSDKATRNYIISTITKYYKEVTDAKVNS